MSVYNGEAFLREAIDSILTQTYRDFEFVIYDDCSTDRTPEIIQSYKDSRIVSRRNIDNQGLTRNLADGVARSEADYIVRMDADDIAYPQRLEKQLEWMDAHTEVSIMGTPVSYFHRIPGDGGISYEPYGNEIIKAYLFISFTLKHPTIIIRRQHLIDNSLNYNPDFRYSQDHTLYFDCIRSGLQFANYSEPLLYMRSHEKSISRVRHATQQECSMRARERFLTSTGMDLGCNKEEIEVYNMFASGVYPKTERAVHTYERFVRKIYENPNTPVYFDKDILLSAMANHLCNGAYFAVSDKSLRAAAIAASHSSLKQFAVKWSLKTKIKFQLKKFISK